jgi:DNA-binding response OmpR family regulator
MEMKILVVDDEPRIIEVVHAYLVQAGFAVQTAQTGLEALSTFDQFAPDLVILDWMLPDLDGEAICRVIRSKSRVPVIFLTARVAEEDLIHALGLGADDYVTKPFSARQLLARVQAVLRRTREVAQPAASQLCFGDGALMVDCQSREVRRDGQLINLTPNEYQILLAMLNYPNKVFTREELIRLALDDDYQGSDRTIDSHIKNLRQKLEPDPRNPSYILTVHGIGYKFGGGG